MTELNTITAALSVPFEPREVKFKPQSVKGNRALALAYIDCRVIQDRLDEVLGVENWMDDYEILTDGSVVCRLKLKLGAEWVTKTDVGSPSEQPDGGDRLKAAFSDALKRAAVKYGIGRYLYRLPPVWTDYDPQKRQFAVVPQLPAWAIPKSKSSAKPVEVNPVNVVEAKPADPVPAAAKAGALPVSGDELHRRLRDFDAKLASQKKCPVGALLTHVAQAGVKAGFGDDISRWNGPALEFAATAAKGFIAALPTAEGESAQAA
jgi:hypothetical protein